jgi:enamine deaminase RidA (YjgF/YER057c/UK114 family)
MTIEHIQPEGVAPSTGYTHVVKAQPGSIIYISGQVGFNAAGELVGENDIAAQAVQVYENIKTCLAAAGASFANVVRLNSYIVNLDPDKRAALAGIRERYIPAGGPPPASTTVGVTSLARPGLLIEIEAVAILP